MILKKIHLSLLTVLIFVQSSYAENNIIDAQQSNLIVQTQKVDTLTTIDKGILTYTEISENTFAEIIVNLNTGKISVTNKKQHEKSIVSELTFNPQNFNINADTIAVSTVYANHNIDAVFANFNQVKGSSCGATAGSLLDLANDMIAEGVKTGNQALIVYGRILRDIATALFQHCIRQ